MLRACELQTAQLARYHGNHQLSAGRRPGGGGSGLPRDDQDPQHQGTGLHHQ